MTFEKRFVPIAPNGEEMWHHAAETEDAAWEKLVMYSSAAGMKDKFVEKGYIVKKLEVPHGTVS